MPAARSKGRTSPRLDDGRPPRILIVEDSIPVAESLQLALQACGMAARVARCGTEGLEETARFAPDVVLIDLGLPDMDGYALARMIDQSGLVPAPVLIALSGRPAPLEAPFAQVLVKPVRLATLLSVLRPQAATCSQCC